MDYKYIEQLIERYWKCETTLVEEHLLRDFFLQDNLPKNLELYRSLFEYELSEQNISLNNAFDEKILSKINQKTVKAHRNTIQDRFRPFYRAAAAVAIIFTLGVAAQHSFNTDNKHANTNYNYSTYKDTYTDPQVAYEQVSSALKTVSSGLRASGLQKSDSVKALPDDNNSHEE